MTNKRRFSFERKRVNDRTKLIILSPIHTRGPKVIAILLIVGFSAFFGMSLVDYIQDEQDARDRD